MKPPYQDVLASLDLLRRLAAFDPVVIGTPPLDLAIPGSDIDVACTSPDFDGFVDVARHAFGHQDNFAIRSIDDLPDPAITAAFNAFGWEIELFCQHIPCAKQAGVRHFRVEARLLALDPGLRQRILTLKVNGLKTEPAFASALKLPGDPYQAMLDIADLTDPQLRALIAAAR